MNGYDEQTWVNGESQANAERFNHMESGIKNAYNVSLIAITNIQPSECNEGDKYFNTDDNLIYTATDTDTWSETGETPISDKTYVLTTDGSTYMYDGTTLTRIGGSQVANEYSESIAIPYSADYSNNMVKDIYSTSEIKTNKIWIDNKPIYRKVISISSSQITGAYTNIEHGISNIDTITLDTKSYYIKNNTIRIFPTIYFGSSNWNGQAYYDNTYIKFELGSDVLSNMQSADGIYVVMEYTKTTD